MTFERGTTVLRSRYRLIDGPTAVGGGAEAWIGIDEMEARYLVKLWPYDGHEPDDLQRALWDAELRTLYRIGSSPGAEDSLLVLRDAGVDRDRHAFVMVLHAPGYETLRRALGTRSTYGWLANRDLTARRDLWSALLRLAEGLRLLHEQHLLHRNLGIDSVFFDPTEGVQSLRLGGFEWSLRLGVPARNDPPPSWSSPPEFFEAGATGYRPETDWYALGMLAARCIFPLESFDANQPAARHQRVMKAVETSKDVSDVERAFLLHLIAADPRERLSRGYEIRARMRDIIWRLDQALDPRAEERPFVLVLEPTQHRLVEQATELGFAPNPERSGDPFNPNDLHHVERFRAFVQDQFVAPQLYAVPDAAFFVLVGTGLIVRVKQDESYDPDLGTTVRTWALGFCSGPGELRGNDGGSQCVELPRGQLVVRTVKEVRRDRTIRQQARNWERYLPKIDRPAQLRASLAKFHDFIRCTNQLELLIRDAEIFRYRVLRSEHEDGVDQIVIVEELRDRPPASFAKTEGGMVEFLHREVESNKPDCKLVGLTTLEEDGLTIAHREKSEFWEIVELGDAEVVLKRHAVGARATPAPAEGALRTYGMIGQVALVKRRKKAIDRLKEHSYLLRSLSAPGQVYMDTGTVPLPTPLPDEAVDRAKRAAIEDVLRVRPIYALQGPPGTGKTTLVAHLVRQILADDKVAQILITAQAHGAVDVLREKVRNEAFRSVADPDLPLAVRLGAPDDSTEDEGSVEQVSRRILEHAQERLSKRAPTALQTEWLVAIGVMLGALRTASVDRVVPDFCELVKRGANLTYCTTSARDLEALADMVQSFDWSIIEEAGKAHGFDLALPLQAGHRWLLIGDHKQLPPYRFSDYGNGIEQLDQAVEVLQRLPDRAGNLLDIEWVRSWQERSTVERQAFKEYARTWLNTFRRIFESCGTAPGAEQLTIDDANGSAAGMLSGQHRMHPTIGELISGAYYDGKVRNCTLDEAGQPLARVVHPFTAPAGIKGKAIVWLDMPWSEHDSRCLERGPHSGHPRFTNPSEASALLWLLDRLEHDGGGNPMGFAVLSPYNQQVSLLNHRFNATPPRLTGLEVKVDQRARRRAANGERTRTRYAHTVDSFQGNQADVIAVSLVRNNPALPGEGLGFLADAPRLNVLLSRAERLLVLVGSWSFFRRQVELVDSADRTHRLWHWRKVIDLMDAWFNSGRALRLAADPSAWSGP